MHRCAWAGEMEPGDPPSELTGCITISRHLPGDVYSFSRHDFPVKLRKSKWDILYNFLFRIIMQIGELMLARIGQREIIRAHFTEIKL